MKLGMRKLRKSRRRVG